MRLVVVCVGTARLPGGGRATPRLLPAPATPRTTGLPLTRVPVAAGIGEAYKQDSHPQKLNLGVGAYRTEVCRGGRAALILLSPSVCLGPRLAISSPLRITPAPASLPLPPWAQEGKPLVLEVVREAERRMMADASQDHEYLSQAGIPTFCQASAALAFGADSAVLREGRNVTVQGLSGTGSLRIGAEVLARFYPGPKLALIPGPTWPNHRSIFERSGMEVESYRYYKPDTRGLNFEVRPGGTAVYCTVLQAGQAGAL